MGWNPDSTQAKDLKSICIMLSKIDCTQIDVSYDGSGDDGSVNEVCFFDENDEEFTGVILNQDNVKNQIKDAAYDILADQDFDWVNNDGGYGTIEINTATAHAVIHHSQRITDELDSTHEVDL